MGRSAHPHSITEFNYSVIIGQGQACSLTQQEIIIKKQAHQIRTINKKKGKLSLVFKMFYCPSGKYMAELSRQRPGLIVQQPGDQRRISICHLTLRFHHIFCKCDDSVIMTFLCCILVFIFCYFLLFADPQVWWIVVTECSWENFV